MRKILSIKEKIGPVNPTVFPEVDGAKIINRVTGDNGYEDTLWSLKYVFDYDFAIEFYQPYADQAAVVVYADIRQSENDSEQADRLQRAENTLAYLKNELIADELEGVEGFAKVEFSDSLV